jgi:mannose-1-phosphate guanylyltransferase/mannose-6-phosphate isomerase
MAGGSGTRLWPLSRKNFPKQFLSLDDKESFIRITARRLMLFTKPEDIYVVGGESHKFNVIEHLSGVTESEFKNLILEPSGRNTAPAIALSVKYLIDKCSADNDTVLFFSPADHIIKPENGLKEAVESATPFAKDHIVTFGIVPSKPETGYGYIELGNESGDNICEVARFVEKPDKKTAEGYLESGKYMWNSGMFMFSVGVILDAFKRFVPELFTMITEWDYDKALRDYESLPSVSIDYAVMEKADNILCRKIDLEWNDVGSWDSVYDMLDKDQNGNAVLGNVEYVDTTGSLVVGSNRLVTLIGIDNAAVIATEDAILVTKRKNTQQVKTLVDKMKDKGRKEVDEHIITYRPWGSYTVLEEGERYKIKRIVVHPGAKLSRQRHKHRSEHWVVVSGMAEVEIGDKVDILHENQSVYVPIYELHRLSNPGKIPLEIIEVQNGEYVGEDDIERLDDTYGRG